MPIYLYRCEFCGDEFERIVRLADHTPTAPCECGHNATQKLTAPMVHMDYAGYECPVSGQWIEGKRAHEENLKRTGCRIFEPGEREQFMRRKAQEDGALSRQIEDDVGRFVDGLGAAERNALGKSLEQNDIVAERV